MIDWLSWIFLIGKLINIISTAQQILRLFRRPIHDFPFTLIVVGKVCWIFYQNFSFSLLALYMIAFNENSFEKEEAIKRKHIKSHLIIEIPLMLSNAVFFIECSLVFQKLSYGRSYSLRISGSSGWCAWPFGFTFRFTPRHMDLLVLFRHSSVAIFDGEKRSARFRVSHSCKLIQLHFVAASLFS